MLVTLTLFGLLVLIALLYLTITTFDSSNEVVRLAAFLIIILGFALAYSLGEASGNRRPQLQQQEEVINPLE